MSSFKLKHSVLLVTSILVLSACPKKADEKADAKTDAKSTPAAVLTVSTQKAKTNLIEERLNLTGNISPWDSLPVNASANGLRITKIYVEEGDMVRENQLLAELDNAALKAQRNQTIARLNSIRAQLNKAYRPIRPQELNSTRATLNLSQAAYDQALDTYNRTTELYREGGVSEAEMVSRKLGLAQAKANLAQSQDRLSLSLEGSRSEDIQIAQAGLKEAEAGLEQINVQLAQTQVKAPRSGLISKRDAKLGDVASPGRALFTLIRDNRLEIEAQVTEADLAKIKSQMPVIITSDARKDLTATAKVRRVSSTLDPVSRQGTVEIDLPSQSAFKAGMFAKADIKIGQYKTLTIPATSIVNQGTQSIVYLLDNKTSIVTSKVVLTGLRQGPWVEIKEGLKTGDEIVTAGAGFLKDGDKVDVAPAIGDLTQEKPSTNRSAQDKL
jgi:HlyD family secretion protein